MEWYVLVDLSRPCHDDVKLAVYRTVRAFSRKDAIRKFQASEWAMSIMGQAGNGSYKVGKMSAVFPGHCNYDALSANIATVS